MKKKIGISLIVIITIIAAAIMGVKMTQSNKIEKIISIISRFDYFEEKIDDIKELLASFAGGGGSGGGGSGGGALFLSGEDVQTHINNIYCIDRNGNVPYEHFGNDSFKGTSSEQTDGTIEGANGATESVFHLTGALNRQLEYTYEAETYQAILQEQTAKSMTGYSGGTRDMNPVEQYLYSQFSIIGADRMQELVWQLYEGGGSVISSGGTASSALDEAKTYDQVIKNIQAPSITANNPTVSYSYTAEEFLIGPFTLNYTRYYIFSSGENCVAQNGKINFSGAVAARMELDDKTITLSSANFVYPNARVAGVAQDAGYEYPYPGETFYVRLPMSSVGDSKTVENLGFKFSNFVEGEGTIADLSGEYVYEEWTPDYEEIWCYPPVTVSYCWGGWKEQSTGKQHYCQHGKAQWCGAKIEVTGYCEHGKNYEHVKEITEWLEFTSASIMSDPQRLVMALEASIYQTYHSAYYDLNLSLRMDYGGIVWEDENTGKEQKRDGLIGYDKNDNMTENGIEGVKVTLYKKGTTEKYVDSTYTTGSVYTGSDGKYSFDQIKMGQYYAVFEYDGQVWEPTTYFDYLEYRDTDEDKEKYPNILSYKEICLNNYLQNKNFTEDEKKALTIEEIEAMLTAEQIAEAKSKARESAFAINSKAQENAEERIAFNNKFKEIIEQGGVSSDGSTITSIKYDTKTAGKSYAITNNSFKELSNNGEFPGSDGLRYFYDSDGLLNSDRLHYGGPVEGVYDDYNYDDYKMTATTMVDTTPENTIDGNYNKISYPREDNVHIETWDKTILGTTYTALYQKNRQINLGLVRRTPADFEVRKDVYKAIVQINGKTEEYTYSSRDNLTESFDVEFRTGPDYGPVEYNRAIYRSDYNYRIEDYKNGITYQNGQVVSKNDGGEQLNEEAKANRDNSTVEDMVKTIMDAKGENSELKIYIIYKITIANRSSVYAGTVNELVDYYDEEYTYTGESWYGEPTTTQNTVVWQEAPKYNSAKEFEGYDTLYTQTTAGLMINSGQKIDIYMKFEVDKHTDETGKTDSIFLDENAVTGKYLGGKNNVVEINNYSTFKPGTTVEQKNNAELVEGKIDKDSRPGSADPNNKDTFEDDTDGAPRMNIILHQSEERSIYGYVWDDDRETNGVTLANGQIVGNGIRENDETLVNGVVVQLIEKIEIDGTTYEYIWREMESGDPNLKYLDYDGNLQEGFLRKGTYISTDENGETLEYEYNYVLGKEQEAYSKSEAIELENEVSAQSNGYYFFDKYIPGNYIVRFIYGDNSSTIETTDNGGKNAISYNGQDYKSTWYKAQLTPDGFYDLGKDENGNDINESNTSKAKDNALRRIDVNKYSEQMDNRIGNVLASPYISPNDPNFQGTTNPNFPPRGTLAAPYTEKNLINELRNNTWMYADTAYINAEVAYATDDTNQNIVSQITAPVYKVENIGFGLEERPRTNIVLTKQIENVTITLVNGTVLVNTAEGIRNGIKVVPNKYEHSEQGKNNYLGFWSFEIDDELIQGAELKIYYRLTVDNNGQVDSVGKDYELNTYDKDGNRIEINKPSSLEKAEEWLGNAYYYGNTAETKPVTTTIDKILDYIDRSIAFNPETESNQGVWYDVESLDKLQEDGLVDANVNIKPKTVDDMGTSNNTMAWTKRGSLINNELKPQNAKLETTDYLKYDNSTSTLLVLTKILGGNSTEYNYKYGNIAEIIQLTNTVGRRDPDQIPGNQAPNIINKDQEPPNPAELENDTDISEPFTITTPTGADQSMVYYIVAGIAAAVFAVGVVLIKKFALKK